MMKAATAVGGIVIIGALSLACRQNLVIEAQPLADGGGGNDAEAGVPFCAGGHGQELGFVTRSAAIIVALDRSTGMNGRFGTTTQLLAAESALATVADKYKNVVRFGYVEFPGPSTSCTTDAGCCASAVTGPNPNVGAFDFALHACDPQPPQCPASSQRPTAAALDACSTALSDPTMQRQPLNGRSVLLVTNGQPTCASSPMGTGCADAANKVNHLAGGGIDTIVVVPSAGPLDPQVDDCLGQLARLGGAPSSPFYLPATSADDLLGTIQMQVANKAKQVCQLHLLDFPPSHEQVAVFYGGILIPRDKTDGWDVDQNGEITLHGSGCDRVLEGGTAPLDVRACSTDAGGMFP